MMMRLDTSWWGRSRRGGRFLREFEAIGGTVISNGQSFAVIYPAEADVIPTALIDWGAIIAEAHDRAIYGF